jgi:LuxR family maltose regulon positive regulatory protein
LAAISMQGRRDPASLIRSFSGSHRFVLDYLIEEVLNQQSENIQNFLLRTAVLDRFTGALCDALTGREDGHVTLQRLDNANLFIVPLDEERRWYRYHQLFADLLCQRLQRTAPEQVSALHQRASEWFGENGFAGQAIDHALRAEEFGRAADLIEAQFDTLYRRGEHTRLRRWLAALPIERVYAKPELCILHAWSLFTSGELDAAEQSLEAAEKGLKVGAQTDRSTGVAPVERDPAPVTDRSRLRGILATMRAFLALYRGKVPETIQYARQALEDLPQEAFTWRSTAAIALGDAYDSRGDLPAAYGARHEALLASKLAGDVYLNTLASLKLAITLRQQGQLQRVLETCEGQMQRAMESGLSQAVVGGTCASWRQTWTPNPFPGSVARSIL